MISGHGFNLPLSSSLGIPPSMVAVHFSPPSSPFHSFILSPRNFSSQTLRGSLSRPFIICHSKKKESGFTDRILDYIEGGPKLRKWYGASDTLPKDGVLKDEDGESPETEEVRDAVLVTNGESEIGQMVILSLILKRAQVKALVKDKKASADAFGTYVESLAGDVSNGSFLSRALRGVRAIICPANDGFFSGAGQMQGVQHIVLLSQLDVYKSAGMFQALINNRLMKFAGNDEKVVIASGIPYTIVKAGLLQDTQGGRQGFCFDKGVASKGRLSKEDAARICVEALDSIPLNGLIFEVVNGDEKVEDWKEWFDAKIKNAEELR